MDVHLRDLRYFIAVAEELHFTRAAARLFVSQPALSRQIAKLEADLGVSLVERNPRAVSLTDAGRILLDRARELVADWDTTEREVSDVASAARAVLRIGMQTSVGRGIISGLSDDLARRRPGWTMQLNQVGWDDPTAGLANRTSDVALCWLPLVDPDAYESVALTTEPRLLAIASSHPLATRESVSFADIEPVPLVALPSAAGRLRDYWLVEDRRHRPAPVATVARTADEAMEAVASELGAVLISSGNVPIYNRPGITFVDVVDLEPSTLAMVWRHDDDRDVIGDLVAIAEERASTRPDGSGTATRHR